MLRKLFGPIGQVAVGCCQKLLHGLYNFKKHWDYQIKDDEVDGHVACIGVTRGKQDSTEMNLQEMGLDDVEWIKLDWILTSDGVL
jgi:hypothetical protein